MHRLEFYVKIILQTKMEVNGMGWEAVWVVIFTACIWIPLIWYNAAIGKRITYEEKKVGRDLTYEINPFTGGRWPIKD
jgi:hypothetical protein